MVQPQARVASTAKLLAVINRLNIKAFSSSTQQALIFLMLNDTAQVLPYDRATLWTLKNGERKLLGISGQANFKRTSELALQWKSVVCGLKDPNIAQIITENSVFRDQDTLQVVTRGINGTSIYWLPLCLDGDAPVGLWLERWNSKPWQAHDTEILNYMRAGYAVAWDKFRSRGKIKEILRTRYPYIILAALTLSLLVRVPLRIVAPCEIVPNDPILVTAPLDGIISEVVVAPGQGVIYGDILFEYDKRVPIQELKIARKQVLIIESELNREMTQGVADNESLADFAVLQLRLQKEELALELVEYRADQLTITAPVDGVVMLDNPDDWRGKPVRVGERVLIISDPKNTKIKIWIAEDDNVILDPDQPVKVFLNINPETSREARLNHVASFTSLSEQQVPGFEAEAHWIEKQHDIKMGLKGNAVLYGDNVSLFYYIFRKPLAYLRALLGI
ncbi:Uncharacterized protein SCG7086_BH_00070 [Chlamydiales bacterium SCGC AG-110-P3]|nr:Uncharacterized protein SCG7086_BH_00070 [Chlamydiales bacterium SCGC AG-110-P3]